MNTYLTIATGLPPTPPPEAVAAFRAKELAVGQELSRFVGPLLFFLPLLTQVHVSLAGAIDARFQYAILGSTLCFIVSHSWAGRQTGGVGWRVLLPFLSCIAVTASLGTITGFLGPIPVIVLFGVMCLYLRHLRHQPALANTVAVLGVLLFGLATALQTRWPELSRVDEMTPTSIRFAPWISSVPPVLPWILGASGTAAYAALAFYFLHASRVAARVALDNELKTWHLKHLVVDIDRRASASELPPKP
jgi:hypothetical protein